MTYGIVCQISKRGDGKRRYLTAREGAVEMTRILYRKGLKARYFYAEGRVNVEL